MIVFFFFDWIPYLFVLAMPFSAIPFWIGNQRNDRNYTLAGILMLSIPGTIFYIYNLIMHIIAYRGVMDDLLDDKKKLRKYSLHFNYNSENKLAFGVSFKL